MADLRSSIRNRHCALTTSLRTPVLFVFLVCVRLCFAPIPLACYFFPAARVHFPRHRVPRLLTRQTRMKAEERRKEEASRRHCAKGETNNNPSSTHFCRTKMTTVPTRHNWMSTAKYQVISRHCEDKRTPRILCSSRVSLWPEIANQYGSTFTPC